jgi:glucose/mannose-6-phosphate isomerase
VPWLQPDSEDLLSATSGLGDQIMAALAAGVALPASVTGAGLNSVVVAGMGGSAVAGEVLQAYAAPRSSLPVVLVNSASPPRFLGPGSLVFAVSFSGETEETLAVASAAVGAGAPVVAVTCGGSLGRLVAGSGGTVVDLAGRRPPVTQPRSAIGATVAPLLIACEGLGLLTGASSELRRAGEQLEVRRTSLSSGEGLAREIARQIGRTIPLFHGASGLGAVAARRWKTQVNENSKSPAAFGVQPEVCHNEVCGFGQQGDVTRQVLTLVSLRTGLEDAVMSRRFELFAELTAEALARVVDVEASGEGELARFFDLVMIGDFVSLHLAAREGIDPGPVPTLSELKLRLASGA